MKKIFGFIFCLFHCIWLNLKEGFLTLAVTGNYISGHDYIPASDSEKDQSGWGELVCKYCGKKSK
jgi:hypothetical protein